MASFLTPGWGMRGQSSIIVACPFTGLAGNWRQWCSAPSFSARQLLNCAPSWLALPAASFILTSVVATLTRNWKLADWPHETSPRHSPLPLQPLDYSPMTDENLKKCHKMRSCLLVA
jgi:hypothetical protein